MATETIKVDIKDATKMLDNLCKGTQKAMPTLLARLALKGERYMKGQVPVLTGTLRRSLYAAPTMKPWSVVSSVNYARFANVRSRRPHFIEKTAAYIERIAPEEAETVIKNVLR